jgi:CDP-diacylglycerol---serine O-phosphatidyltransferase
MGRLRLPDLFTLGNLLSGSIALVYAYQRSWGPMLVAMAVGALCDVVDGALARLLKSPSVLGKELDSLADLVTFGVVPAFALYHYIKPLLADLPYHPEARYVMVVIPFSLPLMAAWRLARFNVESEAEGSPFFSGMPTPFQGLFWAVWVYAEPRGLWLHPLVWSGLVVLIGLLMVSRWPFLSLKKPLLVPSRACRCNPLDGIESVSLSIDRRYPSIGFGVCTSQWRCLWLDALEEAPAAGFEPATLWLTARCSNR